ncbi:hypothetical protein HMPREF9967_1435 [Streptococcus infantis SK1076]|uniref:Uncharacterized protein n=1 Tax=Streptococcus infantis SK1076 TaxID=1005705 RepID=F5W0E3_9STRE|nr:hypothetical protein HMPREF9967_1435 [Streptococcus infantis SK1076]
MVIGCKQLSFHLKVSTWSFFPSYKNIIYFMNVGLQGLIEYHGYFPSILFTITENKNHID